MKKINGRIYIHTNKITGKNYVGQTRANNIESRWRNGAGYRKEYKFGQAIKKYGWNNFEHTVLLEIYKTKDALDKAEIETIELYNSYYNGYNSTLGGNSPGEIVIKAMSDAKKGKISNRKGIPMSEEQKAKISKSLKGKYVGRIMSEETKLKISKSNKGQIPWNKGIKIRDIYPEKTLSSDHKQKISESMKKWHHERKTNKI